MMLASCLFLVFNVVRNLFVVCVHCLAPQEIICIWFSSHMKDMREVFQSLLLVVCKSHDHYAGIFLLPFFLPLCLLL